LPTSPRAVPKDHEFIAFLDEKLVWRFIASPAGGGKKVDRAVLEVAGFCDTNAHTVSPGVVTLEQLTAYLAGRPLVYRFRGPVFFPQLGKVEWKPHSTTITGSYTAIKEEARVEGLPRLKGFPEQPRVFVHTQDGACLDLRYTESSDRPLTFLGKVDGLDDKTGEMLVRFVVSMPELLTKEAFEEYLGDPQKRGCFSTFKLTCRPTNERHLEQVLSLSFGVVTEDRSIMQLKGWDREPLKILVMECHGRTLEYGAHSQLGEKPLPKEVEEELGRKDRLLRMATRTKSGEYLLLVFDGGPTIGEYPFSWTFQSYFVYTLYSRPIRGKVVLCDGAVFKAVASFTTEFDSVGFNGR
jgi:hypothetical protein